ncbi:hypothetical protein D9758_012955 [Tetrapyrgos nigripes]|uniref:Small ribosomal subunit protein uS7 domain-containing protein n=1 Tax=Tetrapyrgos nigripes TaxID=182062 RepID=A0A8H5CKS8_9AGAR|nr:hypothetical protein D9758_012955 [Tetrapyrgos nigripes]
MLRSLSTSLRSSCRPVALRTASLPARSLSSQSTQSSRAEETTEESYNLLANSQQNTGDDIAQLLNLDVLTAPKESNAPPVMNIPPQEDPLLHYLASRIMQSGHRARANRIVARTLLNIHAYTRAPPLPILRQAIFKAAPAVRCLNHRIATKQVLKPIPLSEKQSIGRAITWILEEVEGYPGSKQVRQGGSQLEERLAREIIKIIKGESAVLATKEKVHREAMLNRGSVGKA